MGQATHYHKIDEKDVKEYQTKQPINFVHVYVSYIFDKYKVGDQIGLWYIDKTYRQCTGNILLISKFKSKSHVLESINLTESMKRRVNDIGDGEIIVFSLQMK